MLSIHTNIHFAGFECAQWESVVLPGGIILGNIILLFIYCFFLLLLFVIKVIPMFDLGVIGSLESDAWVECL